MRPDRGRLTILDEDEDGDAFRDRCGVVGLYGDPEARWSGEPVRFPGMDSPARPGAVREALGAKDMECDLPLLLVRNLLPSRLTHWPPPGHWSATVS